MTAATLPWNITCNRATGALNRDPDGDPCGAAVRAMRAGLRPQQHHRAAPPAERRLAAVDWFPNYVARNLERDVRQLLAVRDLTLFQRLARMCAARSGQMRNLAALGADCGISIATARHWLSVLESSYITMRLPPYHRNFGKRLVKAPSKKMVTFDWTPIRYRNAISVLKNPFYAGTYACGKSEKRTTLVEGRLRKSYGHGKPIAQWGMVVVRRCRSPS